MASWQPLHGCPHFHRHSRASVRPETSGVHSTSCTLPRHCRESGNPDTRHHLGVALDSTLSRGRRYPIENTGIPSGRPDAPTPVAGFARNAVGVTVGQAGCMPRYPFLWASSASALSRLARKRPV
jgi:hypothetical protein